MLVIHSCAKNKDFGTLHFITPEVQEENEKRRLEE